MSAHLGGTILYAWNELIKRQMCNKVAVSATCELLADLPKSCNHVCNLSELRNQKSST